MQYIHCVISPTPHEHLQLLEKTGFVWYIDEETEFPVSTDTRENQSQRGTEITGFEFGNLESPNATL